MMNFAQASISALVENAIEALRTLVSDPTTPPSVRLRAIKIILDIAAGSNDQPAPPDPSRKQAQTADHAVIPIRPPEPAASSGEASEPVAGSRAKVVAAAKTGRNDPCPCGSGIKFKKCCLNRPVAGFEVLFPGQDDEPQLAG